MKRSLLADGPYVCSNRGTRHNILYTPPFESWNELFTTKLCLYVNHIVIIARTGRTRGYSPAFFPFNGQLTKPTGDYCTRTKVRWPSMNSTRIQQQQHTSIQQEGNTRNSCPFRNTLSHVCMPTWDTLHPAPLHLGSGSQAHTCIHAHGTTGSVLKNRKEKPKAKARVEKLRKNVEVWMHNDAQTGLKLETKFCSPFSFYA